MNPRMTDCDATEFNPRFMSAAINDIPAGIFPAWWRHEQFVSDWVRMWCGL